MLILKAVRRVRFFAPREINPRHERRNKEYSKFTFPNQL